jgi:hypothetical protein
MNERIRDLGTQAGLYVDLNGTPWPRAMSAEDCEAAYKKFAELIVQECISIVAKRKDQAIDDGCNVDEAMSVTEMDLLEHFGVEE